MVMKLGQVGEFGIHVAYREAPDGYFGYCFVKPDGDFYRNDELNAENFESREIADCLARIFESTPGLIQELYDFPEHVRRPAAHIYFPMLWGDDMLPSKEVIVAVRPDYYWWEDNEANYDAWCAGETCVETSRGVGVVVML